jgi:hypothetical protein
MRVFRFVAFLTATALVFCAAPNRSQARLMAVLSYQELLERSDFVVIASPKSRTTDTKEQAFLPNISLQDKDGKLSKVKSIGVETVFDVAAVFKGDQKTKQFTLHHYREEQSGATLNGPILVFFDPSDPSRSSYLLFLVREPDGRFAPTGGQTDPGYAAISRLSGGSN